MSTQTMYNGGSQNSLSEVTVERNPRAYRSRSASEVRQQRLHKYSMYNTTLDILSWLKRRGTEGDISTQFESPTRASTSIEYAHTARLPAQSSRRVASLGSVLSIKRRLSVRRQRIAPSKAVKKRWQTLKLWVGIRGILSKLHDYVIEKASTDPSRPLYVQLTHADTQAVSGQNNSILFDASIYKADRQMRTTQEVKRILSLPSDQRTEANVYCAMIGLRGIKAISEYPVRMQQYLAKYGTLQCYESRRVIVLQGRIPEAFYFVLYGRVVVAVQDDITGRVEVKCFLQRGHFFGELAIIKASKRQSTVMTVCYTELLALSSDIFQQYFMAGGIKNMNDPDHNSFLRSLPFLQGWPIERILGPTDNTNVTFGYFKRGSVMVKDSNFSDWLIIVKSGSLTIMKKLMRVKPNLTRTSGCSKINSFVDCDIILDAAFTNSQAKSNSNQEFTCPKTPSAATRTSLLATTSPRSHSCTKQTILSTSPRDQTRKPNKTRQNTKARTGRPNSQDDSNVPEETFPDVDQDSAQTEEQITFLHYLDSAYSAKPRCRTAADDNPVFVIVNILTKGFVFGLAQCLFTNQPSLSVVSNGADCILLNKDLFLSHCSSAMMHRLRTEVSPYPSDEKLQDDLLTRVNWDAYKNNVLWEYFTTNGRHKSFCV